MSWDIFKEVTETIDFIERGGPGSGNWGHKGRKGKRGGSAPRKGGGVAAQRKQAGKKTYTRQNVTWKKDRWGDERAEIDTPKGKIRGGVYKKVSYTGKGKSRKQQVKYLGQVLGPGTMGQWTGSNKDRSKVKEWVESAMNERVHGLNPLDIQTYFSSPKLRRL